MILNKPDNYYEVFNLEPNASTDQIRQAYLQAKATYQKDGAALYTLISTEERQETLQMIEEAYKILSSPHRRKEYDLKHGLIENTSGFESPFHPSPSRFSNYSSKFSSIERDSFFENESTHEDILIPPSTDTVSSTNSFQNTEIVRPEPSALDALKQEIEVETEWAGTFLRKVRETQALTVEDVFSDTKINKNYIVAIEEENYPKLPATAYVRGFISQIAKFYRLPVEKVIQGYMSRLNLIREAKKK